MNRISPDPADDKARLRQRIRETLVRLSPEDRRQAAEAARDRVLELVERSGARVLLAYLSDGVELDLDPTIEGLLDCGCTIAVPAVLPERGRMEAARIGSLEPSTFVRDRYDLRSPCDPLNIVDSATLDVVLVPGVAFTPAGHRLGRGGGYYDRLLCELPPRVSRVGVCHAIQVVSTLPIEPHDARMDALIAV